MTLGGLGVAGNALALHAGGADGVRSGVALPEAALRDRERARGRGRSLGPLIFGTLGALQELGALPLPELGAPSTERSMERAAGGVRGALQNLRAPMRALPGRELAPSQRSLAGSSLAPNAPRPGGPP